ncbi:MAG: penicillin-binding protein [Sphingobacteriales bacterium]|nr:MAG: penicillin-binding protein [Sphingobacteriales bacterium]
MPFGDNVYGIKNASLTFFNKAPDQVTVDEAAVLIGMLKGNTYYNPRRNPDNAMRRRNVVLGQMVKYGFLAEGDIQKLVDKPIKLDYHKLDYHEGMAPYFRQEVEQEVKKILKELKKPNSDEHYDIYKDGLKIYTTIDVRMQNYAEQAVEQHIKDIQVAFRGQSGYKDGTIWSKEPYKAELAKTVKQLDRYKDMKEQEKSEAEITKELNRPVKMKVFAWNKTRQRDTVMSPLDSVKYMKMFLQAGFMAMDPFTGAVKAWVGGIDHNYFQYDHVNQDTRRQVGSTIKPLLYTLAIDNGLSPCNSIPTTPQMFPGFMKKPYDAGGSEFGAVPMSKALAQSINNAALYLINQVGINSFVDFAHRCGISSELDKVPSQALGVSDISLFEMLWAYTMFPTLGMNTKPIFITKIEDKNGNLIKNFVPQQKEIINSSTAFKMVKMMRGVIDHGTGQRMRGRYGIDAEIAGKTGTTNKQADAWFIGYTPQLLAGAWVGCDDRYLRFRSEYLGQGAAAALPIWAIFMKKVFADKTLGIEKSAKFIAPDNFQDCEFYDPTSLERAETTPYGSVGESHSADTTLPPTDVEQVPVVPEGEWD